MKKNCIFFPILVHLHHYQYYIQFSKQPSLSLSYCEEQQQQQTTHYLSSGFAILRSSPRFLTTYIDNSQYHNASLSDVDQLLSTPKLTLMSSNENNLLVDSDYNNRTTTTTTTINSFLSTTTATVLNVSSLNTSQRGIKRTYNITLLIGCISASIILIIVIIYAFIKYRNRDEGSYKIDESKNFVPTPHLDHRDNGGCSGKVSSTHHRQKLLTTNEQNGFDSREWYV